MLLPLWTTPLLLLLICATVPLAVQATCPDSCVCASNLIVCTCMPDGPHNLTLGSFSGIDYIGNVYVHSCARVIIPEDCFKRMSIITHLSFKAIGELHVRPNAFREMVKYPSKITFENTVMPRLAHDAFAGLKDVDHVWFKNVTIGEIKHNAFRMTNRLQYVYFYQSRIEMIQHAAFGHMTDIRHIFFKGSNRIGTIADHIFAQSLINEIAFETADIADMHVFALTGIHRVDAIRLINCTIRHTTMTDGRPHQPVMDAGLLEISKSRFSTLALTPYSNFREIKILHCMDIQELVRVPGLHLYNVSLIKFRTSVIQQIRPEALRHSTNVRDIVFEESAIDTISAYALADLVNVGYLIFINTRFNVFKADAFRNATLESFIVDGAQAFAALEPYAMRGLRAKLLKFSSSTITRIHARALQGCTVDQLIIENNQLHQVDDLALHTAQVGRVANITGNTLVAPFAPQLLTGLVTTELNFVGNKLNCECSARRLPLLMMLSVVPRTTYDSWNFRDNQCTEEGKFPKSTSLFIKGCPEEAVQTAMQRHEFGALRCEQTALKVDCACGANTNAVYLTANVVAQLAANVSTISVSQCHTVRLAKGAFSGGQTNLRLLTAIVLSDINYLTIAAETFSRLPNLRRVSIIRSEIPAVSTRAFYLLYGLRRVLLEGTFIAKIQAKAFSFCDIRRLSITGKSRVDLIEAAAFDQTTIGNLTIHRSKIDQIATGAFTAVKRLAAIHLNEAIVGRLRTLDGIVGTSTTTMTSSSTPSTSVCVFRSQFDCACGNTGAHTLLRANKCANVSTNVCGSPAAERGSDAETTLATFETPEMQKKCRQLLPPEPPPSSGGGPAAAASTTQRQLRTLTAATVTLLLVLGTSRNCHCYPGS